MNLSIFDEIFEKHDHHKRSFVLSNVIIFEKSSITKITPAKETLCHLLYIRVHKVA